MAAETTPQPIANGVVLVDELCGCRCSVREHSAGRGPCLNCDWCEQYQCRAFSLRKDGER